MYTIDGGFGEVKGDDGNDLHSTPIFLDVFVPPDIGCDGLLANGPDDMFLTIDPIGGDCGC